MSNRIEATRIQMKYIIFALFAPIVWPNFLFDICLLIVIFFRLHISTFLFFLLWDVMVEA